MLENNFEWFNEKFKNGGKPTIEDKAELFKNISLHLSKRSQEKIEDIIKNSLYNLKKQYSPAYQVIAFNFINCFAPMVFDEDKISNYQKQYKEIMNKYENQDVFSKNFE